MSETCCSPDESADACSESSAMCRTPSWPYLFAARLIGVANARPFDVTARTWSVPHEMEVNLQSEEVSVAPNAMKHATALLAARKLGVRLELLDICARVPTAHEPPEPPPGIAGRARPLSDQLPLALGRKHHHLAAASERVHLELGRCDADDVAIPERWVRCRWIGACAGAGGVKAEAPLQHVAFRIDGYYICPVFSTMPAAQRMPSTHGRTSRADRKSVV